MHERVEETLDSVIEVRLTDEHGRVLIDTRATTAGLEVHGELDRLLSINQR